MTHWGYHLILNGRNCIPASIRSAQHIGVFTSTLVNKIDMVAYGKPEIVMFGTGNKKGFTLVQLIETSNICAHFVEESDDMYLDVFSCKPFDEKVVKKVVDDFFSPATMDTKLILRDAATRMQ
jgi:S-adenosylmethionine/arginine decarboxylase-like enzyme